MFSINEFISLLQRARELGAVKFDYAHYPESSNKPHAQGGRGWRTLYSIRLWGQDSNIIIDGAGYTLKEPFEQAIRNLEHRRKEEDGTDTH